MSEPKPINMIPRYTAVGTDVVKASESGELVLFSDYLALNKHCEWLDKRESFQFRVCKDFEAELNRLRAELKECKSQPDPLTAYLYAAELAKDEMKKLKAENDALSEIKSVMIARNNNLKAEVERLRKAGEWQPIETAPKDGTWVLLGTSDDDVSTGIPEIDGWSSYLAKGRYVNEGGYDQGWMRCSEYSVSIDPTHWMPLPNPPAAKDGKPSE